MTNSFYRPPFLGPEGPRQRVSRWRIAASFAIKIVSAICALFVLVGIVKLVTAIWALSAMQKEFTSASPSEFGAIQGQVLGGGSGIVVLFGYLAWRLWIVGNHILERKTAANIDPLKKVTGILLEFLVVGFSAFAFYDAAISLVGVLGSGLTGNTPNHHKLFDFDNWSIFFFWLPSSEILVSVLLIWPLWKLRKFVVRGPAQADL